MTDEPRNEDLQNPIVHEGARPDARDPNEGADEKATVAEPGDDRR